MGIHTWAGKTGSGSGKSVLDDLAPMVGHLACGVHYMFTVGTDQIA